MTKYFWTVAIKDIRFPAHDEPFARVGVVAESAAAAARLAERAFLPGGDHYVADITCHGRVEFGIETE